MVKHWVFAYFQIFTFSTSRLATSSILPHSPAAIHSLFVRFPPTPAPTQPAFMKSAMRADSADREERNVRKRSAERLDVSRSKRPCGEYLHKARASIVRVDGLRGRHRTWHRHESVPHTLANQSGVDVRRDHVLSAGLFAHRQLLACENRSCANAHIATETPPDRADRGSGVLPCVGRLLVEGHLDKSYAAASRRQTSGANPRIMAIMRPCRTDDSISATILMSRIILPRYTSHKYPTAE